MIWAKPVKITSMITVYGIPNCDTVKKARAWLDGKGIAHRFHDFKKLGISAELLQAWSEAVGWQRLLNRQGSTWRKLDPAVQAVACDSTGACALMAKQPSLIKRPVVQWQGHLSVGFDAADWEKHPVPS